MVHRETLIGAILRWSVAFSTIYILGIPLTNLSGLSTLIERRVFRSNDFPLVALPLAKMVINLKFENISVQINFGKITYHLFVLYPQYSAVDLSFVFLHFVNPIS